jgi:hypothetical protein
MKILFFICGAIFLTFIAMGLFPIVNTEAFKVADFSIKYYYLIGVGLFLTALKFGK